MLLKRRKKKGIVRKFWNQQIQCEFWNVLETVMLHLPERVLGNFGRNGYTVGTGWSVVVLVSVTQTRNYSTHLGLIRVGEDYPSTLTTPSCR